MIMTSDLEQAFLAIKIDTMEEGTMCEKSNLQDVIDVFGLLKSDEEKLEKQISQLTKVRKEYVKELCSTQINEWTAFHAFSLKGCRKLIKMALKCGTDVNLQMGWPIGIPGQCSALHLAAYRGDVSVIKILLGNGAEIDQLDSTNRTPLHYANLKENTLAAKTLIRAGANTHNSNTTQQTDPKTKSPTRFNIPLICIGKRLVSCT